MIHGNIFDNLPAPAHNEFLETLVQRENVRIERIVSHGHTSPEGFWYDQETDEWVMIVQGSARLAFQDGRDEVPLGSGDHIHLPAHMKHRVSWTDPAVTTIWLAVHF